MNNFDSRGENIMLSTTQGKKKLSSKTFNEKTVDENLKRLKQSSLPGEQSLHIMR